MTATNTNANGRNNSSYTTDPVFSKSSIENNNLLHGNVEADDDTRCWKVYPADQWDQLVHRHGADQVKFVYVVRHAEGTHNVNKEYRDIRNLDARLTEKGVAQCQALRDSDFVQKLMPSSSSNDICVVTSTMTRCIQTALCSFPFLAHDDNIEASSPTDIPFLALEALRETVNYSCDRRRSISEIASEFPRIDFSHCHDDDDAIWTSYQQRHDSQQQCQLGQHLESAELHVVAQRGWKAVAFLEQLPQSRLVVCTHSAFLRCILNWGNPGGVPSMPDQLLDQREYTLKQHKIFEYSSLVHENEKDGDLAGPGLHAFEDYMRSDYANAELRSFCLLVR